MLPCLEEFPDELRIGAFDWQVEIVDKGTLADQKGTDDETDVFGITEKAILRIRLEDDWSEQQTVDTCIHELQHAMWYAMGLDDRVEEETAVTALSHAWVMVLRDNPDLAVWFVNHLCGGVDDL